MSVAAVDRTITVIEALADAGEPLEISLIAARVGLPASATHRILATLLARGWVRQDHASSAYVLSLRIAMMAFRCLEARTVPDIVQGALDRLAMDTREYCRLAVVDGSDLVWVARAQGAPAGLRYEPDMGEAIVLHATANGKAWLASMDDADARAILGARGIASERSLGPRCAQTLDAAMAGVAAARRKGHATAVEEAEAGTAAIAVTFRAGSGPSAPVAGTISVAGPVGRLPKSRFAELAARLNTAAIEVGELWPIHAYEERGRAKVARP